MKNGAMLHVYANHSSVDVTVFTKDTALIRYASRRGIPLDNMCAMGDELVDIEMLSTPGLGRAYAPANAQPRVINAVKSLGGMVARGKVFDGFLECYADTTLEGFGHFVTDRDGCLVYAGDYSNGDRFARIMRYNAGRGCPRIAILTGSGLSQQHPFIEKYGLTKDNLGQNPAAADDPNILLLENGALEYNVLTGEVVRHFNGAEALIEELAGMREFFTAEIERCVLPEFGFVRSDGYSNQTCAVYFPDKETMHTTNVPRKTARGEDFRKMPESDIFRRRVVDVISERLSRSGMPFDVVHSG